jgi:hypothetical protein
LSNFNYNVFQTFKLITSWYYKIKIEVKNMSITDEVLVIILAFVWVSRKGVFFSFLSLLWFLKTILVWICPNLSIRTRKKILFCMNLSIRTEK